MHSNSLKCRAELVAMTDGESELKGQRALAECQNVIFRCTVPHYDPCTQMCFEKEVLHFRKRTCNLLIHRSRGKKWF